MSASYRSTKLYRPVFLSNIRRRTQKEMLGIKVMDPPSSREKNEVCIQANTLQVTATAEISLPPDRCRVHIAVSSEKETVQEVKNSVTRRLNYIMQTLHNHQVNEGDINIIRNLRKKDGLCSLTATVSIIFVDINKCLTTSNFLAEKLDESVIISQPEFFHNDSKMEKARVHLSLKAVQNAKKKAQEITKVLGQSLGSPLSIKELGVDEWEGSRSGNIYDDFDSIQSKVDQRTIHLSAKVFGCFELLEKVKSQKTQENMEEKL